MENEDITQKELLSRILRDITTIESASDLKTISLAVKKAYNDKINSVGEDINFDLGAKVQLIPSLQHRKPYATVGVVKKINPVRIQVNFSVYGVYNVPKAYLMAAKS